MTDPDVLRAVRCGGQVAQIAQRERSANEHKSKLSVELNAALQQLDHAKADQTRQQEQIDSLRATEALLQQQVWRLTAACSIAAV